MPNLGTHSHNQVLQKFKNPNFPICINFKIIKTPCFGFGLSDQLSTDKCRRKGY